MRPKWWPTLNPVSTPSSRGSRSSHNLAQWGQTRATIGRWRGHHHRWPHAGIGAASGNLLVAPSANNRHPRQHAGLDEDELTQHIIHPSDLRLAAFWVALERDYTVAELAELAHVNRIFIAAVATLVRTVKELRANPLDTDLLHTAKRYGFLDTTVANIWQTKEDAVHQLRQEAGILPTFKSLDGMGLIEQPTATFYATYEQENESVAEGIKRVIVLAPNAAAPWLNLAHESISTKMLTAIHDAGYTPILVGSSPRPLICPGAKHYISNVAPELIRDIVAIEQPVGVICQTAGREGSSVARMLSKLDIPVLGSTVGATRKVPHAQLDAVLDGLSDAEWRVEQNRNVETTIEATHLAVDAIADGETVAVLGVINSLEQNESRAGTVLAVTPPRKKAAPLTDKAIEITVTMSQMMGLIGFVHADMSSKMAQSPSLSSVLAPVPPCHFGQNFAFRRHFAGLPGLARPKAGGLRR